MKTSELDVSRETLEKLQAFHNLLKKWNSTVNLVSKASLGDAWDRHIRDSAQACDLADTSDHWADLGSGGGLPGLVAAIIASERHPERHVKMVESDTRKSIFLRTVIREIGLPASVVSARIEDVEPLGADILSARALADLTHLLSFAELHLKRSGQAIFFKGATWEKEVEDARKSWSFDLVAHKSKTNPQAAILEIRDIQRD